MNALAVQDERRRFFHQLQACQLPPSHRCTAIVDIGHLRAETADINWELGEQSFAAEFIEHRQRLLRFAECEDWNEHTSVALESTIDCFRQAALFTLACPTGRLRMIASRAFHDQDIDFFLRKYCRLHDRLIVEVDVASIKNRPALAAQQNSGGSENVTRIEKLECQRVCFALWRTFAGD